MTKLDIVQFNAHFRPEIGKKLRDYVRNHVLDHLRFVFYRRMGKTSIYCGFCSNCKQEYTFRESFTPKHGAKWRCEKCRSKVLLHSMGRGRGKLKDRAYVIWYEKSAIDRNAIVATGYKVEIDFKGRMDADIAFEPATRYLFQHGQGAQMAMREHRISGAFYNTAIYFYNDWFLKKEPVTIVGRYTFTAYSQQVKQSMDTAVKGTPFEKTHWQNFYTDDRDAIYIFATIAKYPFVEYLVKTGMGEIAHKLIRGDSLHYCLNLRGKTFESIVGLSKQEFRTWQQSCKMLTAETLRAYKWCRDKAERISWEQAERFGPVIASDYNYKKIQDILRHVPEKRFIRYVENQFQKDKAHFDKSCDIRVEDIVTSYRDYLDEAQELGMDLMAEAVLYPNLLRVAHHKTTSQVKIKQNPIVDKKIKAIQPNLSAFWYETDQLLIRPISNAGELFAEGAYLQHCVGRYGDNYANGQIVLLVVRRQSDPDTPNYTAEIVNGRLIQCRGLKNKAMTTDVKAFMDEFMSMLQSRLIRRGKSKQKQEAVV
jgi:DNA-directed RNA polymerase subunit RPC12/RpoP